MSPKDNNKQVSAAVRILQQKRDASARATHLMVKNDPLITYEKAFGNQAAVKKFFIATFLERKKMSTKTITKRIALVAAAALAIAGFSAVPANAATNTAVYVSIADGITSGGTTDDVANAIAGPANFVTLGFVNASSGLLTITGGTFGVGSGNVTVNTGSTSAVAANTSTGTLTVLTPTVGTITVNYYKNLSAGVYSATVTETVVITVRATGLSGVYSATNSKVYIGAGETYTAITADPSSTITKVKTYGANDSATATILVNYKDGTGTSGAAITWTAKDTITATITSGPGTILVPTTDVAAHGKRFDSVSALWPLAVGGEAGDATSKDSVGLYTASALPDESGKVAFMLFANGQAGTSTITIKNSAGTILGTKTVLFTGTDVSTVEATVLKANVNALTNTGVAGVVSLTLKDSAGNVVTGLAWAPTVTYDVSTLGAYRSNGGAGIDTATSTSSGVVTYGWTPAAATYGPVKVTFTDPTTKAAATVTLNMVSPVATSVTITAPANVALGAPFDFTVTAKDSKGYAIPDGLLASDIIASVSSYAGVTTPALTGKFTNGVAKIAATGPTVNSANGTSIFTMVGTAGTASTNLDKALTATTSTITYIIDGTEGDSTASLALDAANAATDAANNAYDEAQNATQAASDALAAVTALAAQVNSLIAMVKKLTAAVAKLKK